MGVVCLSPEALQVDDNHGCLWIYIWTRLIIEDGSYVMKMQYNRLPASAEDSSDATFISASLWLNGQCVCLVNLSRV